jgi:hypothetical protein
LFRQFGDIMGDGMVTLRRPLDQRQAVAIMLPRNCVALNGNAAATSAADRISPGRGGH